MFVVLMIVVMVTAAGVFVSNSASMEIRSAGYVRQASQTQYIAETGASAAIARLRTDCRSYFTANLRMRALTGLVTAAECPRINIPGGTTATPPCYVFTMDDLNRLTIPTAVFAAPTGSGTARVEGSFGVGNLATDIRVLVTELSADTSPQRGFDMTSTSLAAMPMRYEVESVGVSQQDSAASTTTDPTNPTRGVTTVRAITTINCN